MLLQRKAVITTLGISRILFSDESLVCIFFFLATVGKEEAGEIFPIQSLPYLITQIFGSRNSHVALFRQTNQDDANRPGGIGKKYAGGALVYHTRLRATLTWHGWAGQRSDHREGISIAKLCFVDRSHISRNDLSR